MNAHIHGFAASAFICLFAALTLAASARTREGFNNGWTLEKDGKPSCLAWESPNPGGYEGMGLIDRATVEWSHPEIIDAFNAGRKAADKKR